MLLSAVENSDKYTIYALAQGVKRNRGGETRNPNNGKDDDSEDTKYVKKMLEKFKNVKGRK